MKNRRQFLASTAVVSLAPVAAASPASTTRPSVVPVVDPSSKLGRLALDYYALIDQTADLCSLEGDDYDEEAFDAAVAVMHQAEATLHDAMRETGFRIVQVDDRVYIDLQTHGFNDRARDLSDCPQFVMVYDSVRNAEE